MITKPCRDHLDAMSFAQEGGLHRWGDDLDVGRSHIDKFDQILDRFSSSKSDGHAFFDEFIRLFCTFSFHSPSLLILFLV